ncbi:DUF2280 domain-containing protein [Enterobacter asburiae]|jgi:hypothetical protein|uniref:DUF2280 domain-containing protein n=2 Tax=Enterobacter cloacae complex TaxID=354276 RepID=A0A6S5K9U8_ENTCL|nr:MULTISPECIES: DUF2280 domain-containing protein [Enterobacter cloacae complex]KJW77837.1 phage protein [Enterobacter asburiae]MBT1800742.1 DUF2280 domain-containing protein [Enterobacter kobei]MCK7006373.1 DUF2280 domain-containing protein [Enterobacter kobei]PYZ31105.1 DUF2280 domain-containing protein [Enterobacter cloacae complex sp.]QLU97255.1 DUF2280 domain-containing protein [Enterobacter roggenkampii]
MAALSPEVKAFIVQALACFDTPTQIASQVKQEFGLDISIQQVSSYDPTKAIAKNLGQKWIDLFNATRTRFQTELSDIPIANKAYRLRALNRMMTSAEKMRNMALAASLMEQAAKECGDAYTNKQKVEHSGGLAVSSVASVMDEIGDEDL